MDPEIKKALEEIKHKFAVVEWIGKEVGRLRQVVEQEKSLTPKFVESSPQIRTYGGMVENLLGAETDIYIMGYFDQMMLDKLLLVARYLKIISPTGALQRKKNKDALRRISKAGAKVRTHPMLHARIFCAPERKHLIVGSGDLQTDCFGGTRFDAGIWSNHPDLIKSVLEFFDRVWEESDPLPATSAQ